MKEKENSTSPYDKEITALDKLAQNIMGVIDPEYKNKNILSNKKIKYQNIIDRQLDLSKGVSNGSIVDFIYTTRENAKGITPSKSEIMVDSADIFNKNNNEIFGYFQEIYKNKFIEYRDLKFISKFIPSLGEAVKITLNYICSADNMSDAISRVIKLPDNIDQNTKEMILSEIKRIEKENKILKNLKNTVFKNTLVTGGYYVYCVGYKKLFEEYSVKKESGKFNKHTNAPFKNNSTDKKKAKVDYSLESSTCLIGEDSIAMETLIVPHEIIKDELSKTFTGKDADTMALELDSSLSSFNFIDCNIPFDCLEDVESFAMEAANKKQKSDIMVKNYGEGTYLSDIYKNKSKSDKLKNIYRGVDGTIDTSDAVSNPKGEEFDIGGSYIKYISKKNLTPITTLNTIVGYFHILPIPKYSSNKKGGDSGSASGLLSSSLFSSTNISQKKKDEAMQNIANSISSSIVKQFSSKFVSANAKYKKLIADCIIANGLVNNDYMIQYIPPEDIIEFKINENEDGEGESILSDSLFPAKLLLSIIVCKMLNYVNNSGNKTIAHIYKGPIGTVTKNQLDRVVRNMQESNATFNDLISPNLMFAKFARDNKIALPRARGGNKLVELETQEGQNIDMNTDYENKLEKMAILGTGVPSSFMDRIDDIQFSRQIISDNINFATKISSYQADLEEPMTTFYRKLIESSTLPEDAKQIAVDNLEVKLPRPSVLANSNNSEQLQTLSSLAQLGANVMVGDNNQDPNAGILKDKLAKAIIVTNSPFFDWEKVEKLYKDIQMEMAVTSEDENNKPN